ncbi:MAG: T9SS type A sorting domain-containing protein [Bacteroidia bacterium]|nr:T9SS type A sorting domain-containing protein [Bacteroidia bacterium]
MKTNQLKVLLLLLFTVPPNCLRAQSNFTLDYGFGKQGFVLNDVARFKDDQAVSIVKPSTDKLVVVGHDPNDIVVSVLDTHGRTDATFGSEGSVLVDLGEKETVYNAVQSDGEHILIAGLTRNSNWSYQKNFVAKLSHKSGKLDTSFGETGVAIVPEKQAFDVMGVVLGKDGRFFICGSSSKAIYLYAYKASGELDSAFGTHGRFRYSTKDSALLRFADVAVQFDSMPVLLMNRAYQSALVLRLTPKGTLDKKFNLLPEGAYELLPTELLVTPQSQLLVCGIRRSVVNNKNEAHYAIAKLSSEGVPDSSFGKHGLAIGLNPAHRENSCRTAQLLSNGSILLAGACDSVASNGSRKLNFQFVLFTNEGNLDTTFGKSGFSRFTNFKYNGHHEEVQDFLIADRSLYATGYSTHDLGPSSRSHVTCKLNMVGMATVSVNRFETPLSVSVYPNPTSDFIQIRTDRLVMASVFDSKWKKIKDINYPSSGQPIFLNGVPGLYFVQVDDGRKVFTFKVIKL